MTFVKPYYRRKHGKSDQGGKVTGHYRSGRQKDVWKRNLYGKEKSSEKKKAILKDIVRATPKAMEEKIKEKAREYSIDEQETKRLLTRLKKEGEVYMPKHNEYEVSE